MAAVKIKDHANRGVVALIEHIKDRGATPMTYSDFAKKIDSIRKDGRPNARMGKVLGKTGHMLKDFDPKAPLITVLVKSKSKKMASSGFKEFKPGWNNMSDAKKEQFIEKEKMKIEQYSRSGKFDVFLQSLKINTNTSIEFPSEKADDARTFADGVTVQKHCAYEHRIRNQPIIRSKKESSGYICECCRFNFQENYGPLGESYIECHHIKPLAESKKGGEKIGLKDLAALCANCHRMIHKLLADEKNKYKNNYPQSIKDLRDTVGTLRESRQQRTK